MAYVTVARCASLNTAFHTPVLRINPFHLPLLDIFFWYLHSVSLRVVHGKKI